MVLKMSERLSETAPGLPEKIRRPGLLNDVKVEQLLPMFIGKNQICRHFGRRFCQNRYGVDEISTPETCPNSQEMLHPATRRLSVQIILLLTPPFAVP